MTGCYGPNDITLTVEERAIGEGARMYQSIHAYPKHIDYNEYGLEKCKAVANTLKENGTFAACQQGKPENITLWPGGINYKKG
jgi:hypothetical protein